MAELASEPDDPLVVHCWDRASAQVRVGDARLVALRCRWRLLADRDPVGALTASQQAPDAPAVMPYRARALAALGRAAEARTLAVRSWFDDVAMDLSGVRSLIVALLLTRAFDMASLVSVTEFAHGVVDPVIIAAGETAVARGTARRLTPATPEPAGKSTRGASAVEPGQVCIDSRVDLIVKIYVDGNFVGTVSPWGDACGYYGSGDHRLYARAVFTDGSYQSWGPVSGDASSGFRWTIRN